MWVNLLPYPGYVQSTMASSGQAAHRDENQSWVELLFDVNFGVKDVQLVGLRASERYGCILRNTVEVHHVYVFYS